MRLLSAILLCMIGALYTNAYTQTDSLFIVTYTTGSAWDTDKKPNDQGFFKEHSAHLSSLRKSGVIKVGARYAEKGIIVINASSYQAAKEIIESDQAVANKLFTVDIQSLNVFYDGCIERPKAKN